MHGTLFLLAAEATEPNWLDVLLGKPIRILSLLASTAVFQWLANRAVNKLVARWVSAGNRDRPAPQELRDAATQDLGNLLVGQRREQRGETIGQLCRSIISIALWSMTAILILSEIGINVGPLMASAGVVGVALGFGAQTLVKDYLSGIALILEDQYGVGDIVDVGPVVGVVEEVALRVTRLRDLTGVVWYVRNGEILRVANQSQGWTMAAAVIPVAYDQDLDEIRRIVEEVGDRMSKNTAYDAMMLAKPVFVGVDSVSGEAVFVRVVAKAVPSQTLGLSRAIREELKLAFDQAGIRVPALHRPMSFGPDGVPLPPGSTPPAPPPR